MGLAILPLKIRLLFLMSTCTGLSHCQDHTMLSESAITLQTPLLSLLHSCSAIVFEGFCGEIKMYWCALPLRGRQSGRHNQEDRVIRAPSQLYTCPKGRSLAYRYRAYTQSRVFMYCRQTGALSVENSIRDTKTRMTLIFLCMSRQKVGQPAGRVKSGHGCSSCVKNTPTLSHTDRNSSLHISSCKTECDDAYFGQK